MLFTTVFSTENKLKGCAIRWAGALLALLIVLCFSTPVAHAQCVSGVNSINWTGDDLTGVWSDAANWDLGCTPNNASPNYYDVSLGTSSGTIAFDNGPTTIDTLTLGTLTGLNDFGVAQQLTIGDPTAPSGDTVGVLNNAGTITFSNSSSTLTIDITGAGFNANVTETNSGGIILNGSTLALNDSSNQSALTFTGGGNISLTNGSIVGVSGDEQMVNGTGPGDQLIQGSGLINLDLINNDTVLANNGTLTLRPTGMSANPGIANNGQMTVTSGNTMVWDTTQYQGTGLNAPGSAFNNAGGGFVNVIGPGQLTWLGASGATSYFTNDGTIDLSLFGGGGATLLLSGTNSTFDVGPFYNPNGYINMANASIVGATGSELLINDTGNVITAYGNSYINNLDLVNNGTVSVATGVLVISPSGGSSSPGVRNNGMMNVAGGANLYWDTTFYQGTSVSAPAFNNQGTVMVNDYGILELASPAGDTSYFNNDGTITLGSFNKGTIVLSGAGSTFDLGSAGSTGSVALNGVGSSIYGLSGSELLINDAGHTINANNYSSIYNLDLINNGTVNANAGGVLDIQPTGLSVSPGVTNNGLMQVYNGGNLIWDASIYAGSSLSSAAFNNTSTGTVMVDDGGTLQVYAPNGGEAYFNNDGTMTLGNSTGASVLLVGNGSTFDLGSNAGTGQLNLYGSSSISGWYGNETLINESGHYLTDFGSSTISNLTLVNNGVISSQGGGTTTIESDGNNNITNSGAMNLYSGSTMVWNTNNNLGFGTSFFNYGTVNDNDGGTLELATTGSSGPTVLISNAGNIYVGDSSGGATLELNGNGITYDVFGNGNITLGSSGNSRIVGVTGGELLVNDTGQTIQGAGEIYNLDLTNNGTVIANGPLGIQPTGLSVSPGVTNNGMMQVNAVSTLYWDATVFTGTSLSAPAFNNQGTVTVADNGFLELQAPVNGEAYFNNDGSITVGNTTGATLVLAGAGATFDLGSLAGTGSVTLNNSYLSGFNGSELLINDTGHTLTGYGNSYIYSLDLINNGTVNAATGNLDIRPSGLSTNPGLTNNGAMQVWGGATMFIDTTNGFGGTGYLGTSLSLPAFNNQGTVTVSDGGYLELLAPNGTTSYYNNDGAINVGSVTGANLELAGGGSTFVLGSQGGTGTVTLNHSYVFGYNGTELLVNGAGNNLIANGSSPDSFLFSLNFINNGTVTANGDLVIQPGVNASMAVTNNGAMQVGGSGVLYWDTTNGFGAPGYLGTSLSAPAFNNQGTVTVSDGGYLTLIAPASATAYFNNDGNITIGSSTGAALTLYGSGSTFDLGSVSGTGMVTLNNSYIFGQYGTETLINDTGNTIQGSGTIETLALVNKGTITANAASALTISPNSGGFTNWGTVNTTGAGGLTLNAGSGTLMNGSTGTINVQEGSSLTVNGDFTNSGDLETGNGVSDPGGNMVTISGQLTNNGTINLNGLGDSLTADLTTSGAISLKANNDSLTDNGDLILNSGGSLTLSADKNTATVAGVLTNNTGATVAMNGTNGSISVTKALTNGGTITLAGSGNALSAAGVTSTSFLTLEGNNDTLTDTGDYNNTSGWLTLSADKNTATVSGNFTNSGLATVSIIGTNGSLSVGKTLSNSFLSSIGLNGTGNSLSAAQVDNSGSLRLSGTNETLTDTGDFNNNLGGALTLALFSNGETVKVSGNLINNSTGAFGVQMSGTNGSISVTKALTNAGTMSIAGSGNTLAAAGITNSSTFTISGDSGTVTDTGDFTNNRPGSLTTSGDKDAVTVTGAFNNNAGASIAMNGTNGSISIQGGFTSARGASVTIAGMNNKLTADLDNAGAMSLTGNNDSVVDTGDFDNDSTGSLTLSADSNTVSVSGNFNNVSGASVQMSGTHGSITVSGSGGFTNGGTVMLSGSGDTLSAASFSNSGTVMVGGGESISANTFTQSGSSASLKVNGTLTAATASIYGGMVSGGGTIVGDVSNSGGTVTASDPGSPDILTINGSYTQGSGGTLEAFLGGSAPGTGYSQLLVNGNASLDGTLDVNLINSFLPTSGDNFFLLESTTALVSGTFATLDLPGLPTGDSWDVLYNPGNCPTEGCVDLTIQTTTVTPEPSVFLLLAMGIALMSILRKYRNTVKEGSRVGRLA